VLGKDVGWAMKLTLNTLTAQTIIRVLCLPALVFVGCLLIKMTTTLDEFVHFLQAYKEAGIFSLIVIMTHATQELITALEDYIPNPTTRARGIKIVVCLSFMSMIIIGVTLLRI
jgi:succinate dehydrogenase hydrophobic anchor subunit